MIIGRKIKNQKDTGIGEWRNKLKNEIREWRNKSGTKIDRQTQRERGHFKHSEREIIEQVSWYLYS